ncbi:MAG: DUF4097 family beta strand repeat-containing protein [Raineya sp.]|nr:DUF4097 family beta strand repeat-containing protein [Raineya sp.]
MGKVKLCKWFVIVLFMLFTFAQAQEAEVRKQVERSYPAGSAGLKILNSYGKVHINTHQGKEIKVEVEIIARALSKERANELLSQIQISEKQNEEWITWQTHVKGLKYNQNRNIILNGKRLEIQIFTGEKNSFEVNYLVSVPENTPLHLENNFGDIYLDNHQGKLHVDLSYGSFKAEQLTGKEKIIEIDFGNARTAYIENATLDISYGNADLEESKNIRLDIDYGNIELYRTQNLRLNLSHGKAEISKVENLQADVDFASRFFVGEVSGDLNIDFSYTPNVKIEDISKNARNIEIDADYTNVTLQFKENTSGNFEVRTQYGSLYVDKSKFNLQEKETEWKEKSYKGSFGKNPTMQIKVRAKYGDVKFR